MRSKKTERLISPLRYADYAVTLSEVPTEISLTLSISNCRFRCAGCHSPELQKDIGRCLLDDLDALTGRYSGLVSCVCFLGEGQNWPELRRALYRVRAMDLKTCLYSGFSSLTPFQSLLPLLDYLKLGDYREALGG